MAATLTAMDQDVVPATTDQEVALPRPPTPPVPRAPRHRPGVRPSPFWKKLIRRNLQEIQNDHLIEGRFDPHSFFKTAKKRSDFYSNHPVRNTQSEDNHKFARWAIEEALREYLPDTRFEVVGATMQDHSMVVGRSKRKVSKEVWEAVGATGQEQIDAEDPNGLKEVDGEIVQDVGAISHAVISASPNSLGPPIEACAMYLQMQKCGTYGRNDMTIWTSPLFPTLDGRDGRKGLLDNQITAIVWIMSRFLGNLPRLKIKRKALWDDKKQKYTQAPETAADKENRVRLRGPKYLGGILADSMGLGKTLTTIACLDILANQRLNVPKENGKFRYRPMLILTPNATVATQWMEEIEQIAGDRGIRKILISGDGIKKKPHQKRVHILSAREVTKQWPDTLNYVWNEDDFSAARVVMIMSIDTWAGRTCKSEGETEKDLKWWSTFTESERKFSVVVVDEAYKIRNSATRNWKSVALLERQFTLLITATPCMNLLTDLLGPVRLLWQSPERFHRNRQPERWKSIDKKFTLPRHLQQLDTIQPWDDQQLVSGRPALISQLIYRYRSSTTIDIQDTRKFLKYFESLAILRRAPSSYLYTDWEKTRLVSLEGLLPKVDNYTVNIQLDHALEKAYQDAHIDLFINYMEAVNKWETDRSNDKPPKSVFTLHRQFPLASSSPAIYRLDKLLSKNKFSTKVESIHTMRRAGVNFMRLAPFLIEQDDPEPKVALDFIKLAVRRSPVLRYILHYVKENLLGRGPNGKIKKLLITESSPILAYYYELVLQFLFIHCRTLHSGLSPDERRELIASFNDDEDDSCQVMIQMYTVGFAGSNLHRNCAQVLVASQATSLAVQWQAIHRVIRVGQESDVKVYRLKVNNSYHSFRESRQIDKILPELGTRAQGNMNEILVQLLNFFQPEIDDLWKSKEAQRLMSTMDMLSDPIEEQEDEGEPPSKRIKQEDETTIKLEASDEDPPKDDPDDNTGDDPENLSEDNSDDDSVLTENSYEFDTTRKRKREGSPRLPIKYDTAGIFQHELRNFLELKPRSEYYKEFKWFPREVKSFFCHKKNNLRRLLSYGNLKNHNATRRVWKVKDLDNSAVLERAMELMLRVRLGASNIEMLPLPHINLSLAPREKLERLAGLLGNANVTDQDIDAAREGNESKSKSPRLKGPNPLRKIKEGMSVEEIDKSLTDDITGGGTGRKRRCNLKAIRERKSSKVLQDSAHEQEEEDTEDEDVVNEDDTEDEDEDGDRDEGEGDLDDEGADTLGISRGPLNRRPRIKEESPAGGIISLTNSIPSYDQPFVIDDSE